MGGHVVGLVIAHGALGWRRFAQLPVGLLGGELHVHHGVGETFFVTQRHDAVVEVLHDAALRNIELVVRPHAATPCLAVVLRVVLRILGELDGDDEGGKDDDLRIDRVDV